MCWLLSAAGLLLARPGSNRQESKPRKRSGTVRLPLLLLRTVFGSSDRHCEEEGTLRTVRVPTAANTNSLESDPHPSYNLRGGLTTVVRTGLYTSRRKLLIWFIRCCAGRLSPISPHGCMENVTNSSGRSGWTATYYYHSQHMGVDEWGTTYLSGVALVIVSVEDSSPAGEQRLQSLRSM